MIGYRHHKYVIWLFRYEYGIGYWISGLRYEQIWTPLNRFGLEYGQKNIRTIFTPTNNFPSQLRVGMKTVRIFSDRIRDRIRLEEFKSVRIRVRIFNIRYRIRIRIIKSHIYDVDIQSYHIRHGWQYSYSNPNPDRNMKTNVISMISVRIRSVFIPNASCRFEWWNEKLACIG